MPGAAYAIAASAVLAAGMAPVGRLILTGYPSAVSSLPGDGPAADVRA